MTALPCAAAVAGEQARRLIQRIRVLDRVSAPADAGAEAQAQLALLEAAAVKLVPATADGALFIGVLAHDALTNSCTDTDILRARALVGRLVTYLEGQVPDGKRQLDYYS